MPRKLLVYPVNFKSRSGTRTYSAPASSAAESVSASASVTGESGFHRAKSSHAAMSSIRYNAGAKSLRL